MKEALTLQDVLLAATAVAAGVAAGILFRFLLRWLRGRARATASRMNDAIVDALRNLVFWALIVAGVWAAVALLPLTTSLSEWVNGLLSAALILFATLAAMRMTSSVVRSMLSRSEVAGSATIFVNIARIAVLVVGILIVLQTVGVSITPLLTAMGVGGVAVALALQDTLANLFAGVHILASKKVKPGDYVHLSDDTEGYIVDIDWRNTTMSDLLDNMVIVPNAQLAGAVITNYHQPRQALMIVVQVGVSYDSDLAHVERVTTEVGREVLSEVTGGVRHFQPVMRFHTFGEYSIGASVILQIDEYGDQYLIKHEFIKRVHERYRAEGIPIPYPIHAFDMQERARLATTGAM